MFIVLYDDEQGICVPYGPDKDCEGALDAPCGRGMVLVFANRTLAKKAINISVQYAKLCKVQGKPVNEDFLQYKGYIKVMPCTLVSEDN